MVNIIEPTARQSVVINAGTGETRYEQQGPLSEQEQLSKNALMAEQMQRMNAESQDYQAELWAQQGMNIDPTFQIPPQDPSQEFQEDNPEYFDDPNYQEAQEEYAEGEEVEEEEAPRKRKKKSSKKVEGSLGYNLRQKNKEVDYYQKQLDAKESIHQQALQREKEEKEHIRKTYALALEKQKVEENISKVSTVLREARVDQDIQTEVDASIILQKLVNQQANIDREASQLYLQSQPEESEESEFDQAALQELSRISDPRDLRSPAYAAFLEKFPICNPFSDDYDSDLAKEIWTLRKEHNRDLKISGMSSYIGDPDYYSEIQDLVSDHFNKSKKPRRTTQRQQQPRYEESYDTGEDMNYYQRGTEHKITFGQNDQYDSNYGPNYDPNFRKTSDYRNEDGGVQGRSVPQPQNRPPLYQNRQGYYPPVVQPQYDRRVAPPNYAPVAPVNRDNYGRQSMDLPELDMIERNMARAMVGMTHPDGRMMNENERIMEYRRNKGERLNGAYRR